MRSVNRTGRHLEAALEGRIAGASLGRVRSQARTRREVTRLIDRIRRLVAEQRRLEARAGAEPSEANEREITRLQRRLATVVKRELTS